MVFLVDSVSFCTRLPTTSVFSVEVCHLYPQDMYLPTITGILSYNQEAVLYFPCRHSNVPFLTKETLVRFQVLVTTNMKMTVFLKAASISLVKTDRK
jgi:hypothetical protein